MDYSTKSTFLFITSSYPGSENEGNDYSDESENEGVSHPYLTSDFEKNFEKKTLRLNGHDISLHDDILDYDQKANINRQGILSPLLTPKVTTPKYLIIEILPILRLQIPRYFRLSMNVYIPFL